MNQGIGDQLADGELGTLLSCSATIRWWRDAAYFAQAGRGMKALSGPLNITMRSLVSW